ncbi:dockerin type I domain-containing protein [Planctomycetaceae bacterium SH139]
MTAEKYERSELGRAPLLPRLLGMLSFGAVADVVGGAVSRRARPVLPARRRLRFQSLETRRLLVGEGDPYSLVRNFETLGFAGDLSAVVDWQDGSTSNATVTGGEASGRVFATIDYSLDTDRFFNNQRKQVLQSVVDAVLSHLNDSLSAITPGGSNTWTLRVTHPETGQTELVEDVAFDAGELRIYAGSKPIPGIGLAEGGPGGYQGVIGDPAFLNAVARRGQGVVSGTNANDFAPWGGTLTFDNSADWYFGTDPNVTAGRADFVTTAAHELFHLLGFGLSDSWSRYVSGDSFLGPASRAAYDGNGNVPLLPGNAGQHWNRDLADGGQETLMDPDQLEGTRKLPTKLDFAGLADLGWEVVHPTARVTAEHVFADNGSYPTAITLTGSRLGSSQATVMANIDNVAPTVVLADVASVVAGVPFSITNFAEISDPGFRNTNVTPATNETFTYSVDWGDGSPRDEGQATVDRIGNSQRLTLASFDAAHAYSEPGTYQVVVRVSDDDNGVTTEELSITVVAGTSLNLSSSREQVSEAGNPASILTLRRSGGLISESLQVALSSSDTSEATVPADVTFAAGETSKSVVLTPVDDNLLDGNQTVEITASVAGNNLASVGLVITDAERLTATFLDTEVLENAGEQAVRLRVSRSNTNVDESLRVTVSGGDATQLRPREEIVIPAGQQAVVVRLDVVDDTLPEPKRRVSLSVSAEGYQGDSDDVTVLDDEPLFFQNPNDPLDVNGDGKVRPIDALQIINVLNRTGGPRMLDPLVDPAPPYFDVSGDYLLSPIDALQIINAINRGEAEGEASDEGGLLGAGEVLAAGKVTADDEFELGWVDAQWFSLLEDETRRRLR